jgi:hypothetical protein
MPKKDPHKMTANVKALAMWLEFIAVSARLPMLGKDIIFQEKI